MCSDMSPIRSSDALMRRALTTIRRSRATGCWRARNQDGELVEFEGRDVDAVVFLDDGLGEGDVRS